MATTDLPHHMRAAQNIDYDRPYKIQTVPVPKSLGPHDILIKVAVASYCHTDSMVNHGQVSTKLPCTASHEGSGTIVCVGSAVKDFQIGDRVMAGLPVNRCLKCDDCRGPEAYRQYCQNIDGYLGVTLDGAFAEYMRADSRESCAIPKGVDFETAAPLACAGCTIYRALLQTDLKTGQTVGLIGAGGGLGHLGVQMAKARGLRVIGIDARDDALTLARECGADIVSDARKGQESVVREVQKATGGKGVDASITLSDHPTSAALSCALTMMHGTMVQIAQPKEVSIPFHELIFRDIRVKGSLICTKAEAQEMLQTVADHQIQVKKSIFFGLDEIPNLIEQAHSGQLIGKGMIVVDETEQQKVRERQR